MAELSLIVAAYNMERELPRTIFTLSPSYQGVAQHRYEIIIVDNGSDAAIDEREFGKIAPNVSVLRFESGNPSPAAAVNAAVAQSNSPYVGLFIDGARMVSPGVVSQALSALYSDSGKIVGTLAFHLGPDVQMRSVLAGYDQSVEDELLEASPWRDNGYALFDISALAGSSANGWFGPISESNGCFLHRRIWEKLGGLDERFDAPGGGFVNLDFWKRAVTASGDRIWMILGEGTFHQVHGGAATNGAVKDRAAMAEQYVRLRGQGFKMHDYNSQFVGRLDDKLLKKFGAKEQQGRRFAHTINGRRFESDLGPDLLAGIQKGTLNSVYRGRKFLKNPFDIALYLQLLQRLGPKTIIEVGTAEGGSACWFRDNTRSLGLDCNIICIDTKAPQEKIEGAEFYAADSGNPGETFPHDRIAAAQHPILVVEDSAHRYENTLATLEYFDAHFDSGDYIVVEDGIVADMRGKQYQSYKDGPNRAVHDFLIKNPGRYEVDESLADFFGHNVTYCPNGWLKRIV